MTRIQLEGASYCFCLPDNGWGATMPASINTSSGAIALPGEPVLFLVGQRFNGKLVMAGQGHDSGSAWFYDGANWQVLGTTYGVSPCAFGADALYVATSPQTYIRCDLATHVVQTIKVAQIGSQGFRYIDGQQPITGDLTYRDGELFEWTRRGDVRAGQGHVGGCVINGRILDPGDRRFVRFERDWDRLAVAMVDLPGRAAILHWLNVSDLASLPPYVEAPIPVPVPTPAPVPQPKPEPIPMPTLPQAVKASRDRYVAKYPIPRGPNPSDDTFENICRGYILGLAEQVRFDTNDAAWGVKKSAEGHPQSKDSLANNGPRLINYDLLSGVGTGSPSLVSDPQGADITGQVFMPVAAINHLGNVTEPPAPVPVPTQPPTQPPAVDLGPLLEKIAANDRRIDALEAVIGALTASVEALKQPKRYRVVGSTGRTYGHAHSVDVRLEEIA